MLCDSCGGKFEGISVHDLIHVVYSNRRTFRTLRRFLLKRFRSNKRLIEIVDEQIFKTDIKWRKSC